MSCTGQHRSSTNRHAPIRIFVCVGTKSEGLPCCASCNSAHLLQKLRREIAAHGREAVHLDVRPCSCLGLCEEGPVILAVRDEAAHESQPPSASGTASAERLLIAQFSKVDESMLPDIISKILQGD